MPISALPSKEGIGTLGENAFRFVDFLHTARASVWQVLPLNPTNYGDSPYASCCSNALNYYFIDLNLLAEKGLLSKEELADSDWGESERRVNYGIQFTQKTALLRKAFSRFSRAGEFETFVKNGEYHDFAVFMFLKCKFSHVSWEKWEEPFRTYREDAVNAYLKENYEEYLFWQFTQFIFLEQWNALRAYAHKKGVSIMGDIPLYLAYDSVEMWKYGGEFFKVDGEGKPVTVAGVPPDAFSDDGQLWGNPVYDWKKMKQNGYAWWRGRIRKCLALFDILRIDHFRGFDRFYEIPFGHTTARYGTWSDGPKEELFEGLLQENIVAEDLGVIDDGVIRLMKNVGYPGMKILEFAFDGNPRNEHKPSNYTENFVCYTGTHDNMPLRQYIDDFGEEGRTAYAKDLATECEKLGLRAQTRSSESLCRSVIRLAFFSKARTVIIPLWDILAMGVEARFNLPSTVSNLNWSWRFTEQDFTQKCAVKLRTLARRAGRIG